jgi:hypothetical protein
LLEGSTGGIQAAGERGNSTMAPSRRVEVLLSDEEYAQLEVVATKSDRPIDELIHLAIRQVYMSQLDEHAATEEVYRMAQTPLLLEGEDEIGIGGPEILPRHRPRVIPPDDVEDSEHPPS